MKDVISIQHSTPAPTFSKFEEPQILGPICPKNMNEKNFEKIKLNQISVNMENFTFGDQICPKNTLGQSISTNAT